jgi:hypothetical protein
VIRLERETVQDKQVECAPQGVVLVSGSHRGTPFFCSYRQVR